MPYSTGPGLAAGLFGLLILGFLSGGAHADQAACKSLADAMLANTQTPYHGTGTITVGITGGAADLGGANSLQSMQTETIFTGTDIFVKLPSGQWKNVHAALDEVKARVLASAQSFTDCQRLADETDDGKNLAVYTGSATTPNVLVTTKVWVAPGRGVLVRSETDMTGMPQADGTIRRQHLSMRYDYDNVKAPANVQQ